LSLVLPRGLENTLWAKDSNQYNESSLSKVVDPYRISPLYSGGSILSPTSLSAKLTRKLYTYIS